MSDSNNPYASPSADVAVAAEPTPELMYVGAISRGAWLGGYALLINGILVILEMIVTKTSPSFPAGLVFDLVIGVSLIQRKEKYLRWALIRVVFGAIVFTGMSVVKGDVVSGVLQLLVSGSMFGLLYGNAGMKRIWASGIVFGGYILLAIAGLFMT